MKNIYIFLQKKDEVVLLIGMVINGPKIIAEILSSCHIDYLPALFDSQILPCLEAGIIQTVPTFEFDNANIIAVFKVP